MPTVTITRNGAYNWGSNPQYISYNGYSSGVAHCYQSFSGSDARLDGSPIAWAGTKITAITLKGFRVQNKTSAVQQGRYGFKPLYTQNNGVWSGTGFGKTAGKNTWYGGSYIGSRDVPHNTTVTWSYTTTNTTDLEAIRQCWIAGYPIGFGYTEWRTSLGGTTYAHWIYNDTWQIDVTFEYDSGVYYFDGAVQQKCMVYYYDGTDFRLCLPYVWGTPSSNDGKFHLAGFTT